MTGISFHRPPPIEPDDEPLPHPEPPPEEDPVPHPDPIIVFPRVNLDHIDFPTETVASIFLSIKELETNRLNRRRRGIYMH
jgi:hypothetical protein